MDDIDPKSSKSKGGVKMKVELKLYISERLKNRIKILAEEKGLSMNEYATMLLEKGLYQELEEEIEYGKVEY